MRAIESPAQGEDSVRIITPNKNPRAVDWFSEGPIKKGGGPKDKQEKG